MLARLPDEVVDPDALLDLLGACCRQAIKDYSAGPQVCGHQHYATAKMFLEQSGLIDRVDTPTHASVPHQLTLFTRD